MSDMALNVKCTYCGKLNPYRIECLCEGKQRAKAEQTKRYDRTVRRATNKMYDDFYHSKAWYMQRDYINRKYNGLCLHCLIVKNKITTKENEKIIVHHIESLKESWGKRLDENNLLTLCHTDHEDKDVADSKEHCIYLINEYNKRYKGL